MDSQGEDELSRPIRVATVDVQEVHPGSSNQCRYTLQSARPSRARDWDLGLDRLGTWRKQIKAKLRPSGTGDGGNQHARRLDFNGVDQVHDLTTDHPARLSGRQWGSWHLTGSPCRCRSGKRKQECCHAESAQGAEPEGSAPCRDCVARNHQIKIWRLAELDLEIIARKIRGSTESLGKNRDRRVAAGNTERRHAVGIRLA